MKTGSIVPLAALVALSVAWPLAAQSQSGTVVVTKPTAKALGTHHLAGEVVSVNAESSSITVRHVAKKKFRLMTFALTGDAAAHMSDFKTGDAVKVAYVDDAGRLVAQSIVRSTPAVKK